MPRGNYFSPDEDEIIREMVKRKSTCREIAELLNRPTRSIESRLKYLGIRIGRFDPWTKEELEVLIDNIDKDYATLQSVLPGRSYWAIVAKKQYFEKHGSTLVQKRD